MAKDRAATGKLRRMFGIVVKSGSIQSWKSMMLQYCKHTYIIATDKVLFSSENADIFLISS